MITCDSKSLLTALQSCSRLTSKRSTLPVLSCVKLSSRDNILTCEASDRDCFISVKVPSDGAIEPLCVPASLLMGAVGACDGSVRLEVKSQKLLVQDGEMEIAGLLAEEFVPVPSTEGADSGLDCQQVALGLTAATRAVYKNPDRYHGQFVHVGSNGIVARVQSTDFRRITRWSFPSTASCSAMVHGNYCQECIEALILPGAVVVISEKHFIVRHNTGFLAVKLGSDSPANFDQVFQSCKDVLIGTVNRDDLKKLIRDSLPFTTDQCSSVILDFSKSGVECSVESGIGQYKRSIAGNFEPLIFGVFPKYMMDALMSCGEELEIHGIDHLEPMQIKSGNFTGLLCGVNVSVVGEKVAARDVKLKEKG